MCRTLWSFNFGLFENIIIRHNKKMNLKKVKLTRNKLNRKKNKPNPTPKKKLTSINLTISLISATGTKPKGLRNLFSYENYMGWGGVLTMINMLRCKCKKMLMRVKIPFA